MESRIQEFIGSPYIWGDSYNRLSELLGDRSSACVDDNNKKETHSVLRVHAHYIGLDASFCILDEKIYKHLLFKVESSD